MRFPIILTLVAATTCSNLSATAADKITDADKAKLQAQVESLKKQKLDAAAKSAQHQADMAKREVQKVDEKQRQNNAHLDNVHANLNRRIGTEAADKVVAAHKQAINAEAQAEKDQIAKAARDKAARQEAAAKKQAENINQSIEGLKSQVSKDGKHGLQPKGSNLYVRHYGK